MSLDELIALLAGWTGRRVTVTVATHGEPSVTAAAFEGLLAGPAWVHDRGEQAAVFRLAGALAAFAVAPAAFVGAMFSAQDRPTVVVGLGALSLWIALRAD